MTRLSVPERFTRFLRQIAPTKVELQKAERRLTRIGNRLKGDFEVRRLHMMGSHWKGTAVRKYSDVDLFVVVSRDEARKWSPDLDSKTLLKRFRNSITRSFTQSTIRRDGQAMAVRFEQGAFAVDVVPAIFERFSTAAGVPLYLIPSGDGDWLRTAPDLQKRYFDAKDRESGGKLKYLVRMMKWWTMSRPGTAPLKSLYLEHFIIACNVPIGMTYPAALAECLDALATSGCSSLPDPMLISRDFCPVSTAAQRSAIKRLAEQSANRAARAVEADRSGRTGDAVRAWALVFNKAWPWSIY